MGNANRTKSQLLEEIERLNSELAAVKRMTEQRTHELYVSEERFSLAMRGANDGLWDWNLETDDVYYSPRWKSMLGYKESELENNLNTWASLVNSDDKVVALEKVQDYFDGRKDSFEVEMRMRHKDGHEVFVLSRAILLRADRTVNRFVSSVRTSISPNAKKPKRMTVNRPKSLR